MKKMSGPLVLCDTF